MTVAQRYAREGWASYLDLDGEKSAKVAAEIKPIRRTRLGHAINVTSESATGSARRSRRREFRCTAPGRALANIADITSPVPFLDHVDLSNGVMTVNAPEPTCHQAFLPEMIDNGGSHRQHIIVSAQRGGGVFGKVPYSSAKAAILDFTRPWPVKSPTRRHGQRRHPGAVNTNIRSVRPTSKRPSWRATSLSAAPRPPR